MVDVASQILVKAQIHHYPDRCGRLAQLPKPHSGQVVRISWKEKLVLAVKQFEKNVPCDTEVGTMTAA
jgi:hypothetical protein